MFTPSTLLDLNCKNFKDKNYRFIYPQRSFTKLAQPYSKQGILGVLGDFSYIHTIDGLTISRDGDITLFHALEGSSEVWLELENTFRSIWKH